MMSRICRPYEYLFLSLMFIDIIRFFVTLQQNSLPACIACISVTVSHSYAEDVRGGGGGFCFENRACVLLYVLP